MDQPSSSSQPHDSFLESSTFNARPKGDIDHSTTPSFPASSAGPPNSGAPPRGGRSLSNSPHTRRLHLRNAGFRGPNVPARRVTPVNTSSTATTTTTWSAGQLSDAENVSPLGRKRVEQDGEDDDKGKQENLNKEKSTRRSIGVGVLHDIANSAASRRSRPRVSSGKMRTNAAASEALVALDHNSSPPQPFTAATTNTNKQRSLRARPKMNRVHRRSTSRGKTEYIEHLEQRLESTMAQLHAMEAASNSTEQSDKIRHLNAEVQRLHAELLAWENKFDERFFDAIDKHHKREAELQAQIRSLKQELQVERKARNDAETSLAQRFKAATGASLEAQLKTMAERLARVEARNADLEAQNVKTHSLLASSASPLKIDTDVASSGRPRRDRPMSMIGRVPTAGSLAICMSPDRHAQSQPTSPAFYPRAKYSPEGPASPLNLCFSPDIASPDANGTESDASLGNSVIHVPDTTSKRRHMRRLGGNEPKPLLLPKTHFADKSPSNRSSARFSTCQDEPAFKFPAREPSDGSPRSNSRPSSLQFNATALSRLTSGWNIDSAVDMDTSLQLQSPGSPSFGMRDFSTGTMDSTIGKSCGRNLMDELTAARVASTSTTSEQHAAEVDQYQVVKFDESLGTVLRSSPFDEEVEELPDDDSHLKFARTDAVYTSMPVEAGSSSSAVFSPQVLVAERRLPEPIATLTHARSRNSSVSFGAASLGATSRSSSSTLDSLRTIFSNLFRQPVEVVKHLIQAAQARMSIPRPLLSVQWWLVGILFGPMARRAMLGRSASRTSSERQSLLEDANSRDPDDDDGKALCYSSAYQTPKPSPYTVGIGTHSMVAGTGVKRARGLSINTAAAVATGVGVGPAKHCVHRPRRWKHSPLLWLKFSMCLAVAVGVAFKDGPSSLLKEAVCQACAGKKSNWRKADRDEPFTPTS